MNIGQIISGVVNEVKSNAKYNSRKIKVQTKRKIRYIRQKQEEKPKTLYNTFFSPQAKEQRTIKRLQKAEDRMIYTEKIRKEEAEREKNLGTPSQVWRAKGYKGT